MNSARFNVFGRRTRNVVFVRIKHVSVNKKLACVVLTTDRKNAQKYVYGQTRARVIITSYANATGRKWLEYNADPTIFVKSPTIRHDVLVTRVVAVDGRRGNVVTTNDTTRAAACRRFISSVCST